MKCHRSKRKERGFHKSDSTFGLQAFIRALICLGASQHEHEHEYAHDGAEHTIFVGSPQSLEHRILAKRVAAGSFRSLRRRSFQGS